MSYRVGTPHFNLPQTENADKRDWFDTNEAFLEVDEHLYTTEQQGLDLSERVDVLTSDLNVVTERVTTAEGKLVDVQADVDTANESIGQLNVNLTKVKQDILDMICAYQEARAVSEHQYRTGDFFIYNETLWKCTNDIPVGGQIVPDLNCENTTLTELIKALQ